MREESAESIEFISRYLDRHSAMIRSLPVGQLVKAIELLTAAYEGERQVFIAGNGGSAANAAHMANDLTHGVAKSGRPGFRATALAANLSVVTALANDEGYAEIFAAQLRALARPGDLLVVLSASGESANVVKAVAAARELKLRSIAFLAMGGGRVAGMADVPVVVPADDYGPAEDAHLMLGHLFVAYFRSVAGTGKAAPAASRALS